MDFEEKLIRNRLFRISADFEDLYNLDDVHYICTLFCGDRYFRVRIFNLGWDEIRYPGLASAVVVEDYILVSVPVHASSPIQNQLINFIK